MCKMVYIPALGNSLAAPQKVKRATLYDLAISPLGIHPRELKIHSPAKTYTQMIYNSIILSSQEVETT